MHKAKEEPRFQKYAFDPELSGKRGVQELHGVFGDELAKSGYSSGFQIKRFRMGYKKRTPEWARTKKSIQEVLLAAFPRLRISESQRKRAGRWAQVINLYYCLGWSASEISEELGYGMRAPVDMMIMRINRVANGFTVHGTPRTKAKQNDKC